jgi:hypothetical protein
MSNSRRRSNPIATMSINSSVLIFLSFSNASKSRIEQTALLTSLGGFETDSRQRLHREFGSQRLHPLQLDERIVNVMINDSLYFKIV